MDNWWAEEHPRVLVVGAAVFGRASGTGITLSNLFAGWPGQRLAQLYAEDREPATDVCQRFLRLDPRCAPVEYHLYRWRARTIRGTSSGVPDRSGVGGAGAGGAGVEPGSLRARMRAELRAGVEPGSLRARMRAELRAGVEPGSLRARMRAELRAFVDLSPLRVPAGARRWMREQRPQVVYATLGSIRQMRLAVLAARECGVPLVPHFMDDWPSTLYTDRQTLGVARRALLAEVREVIRHSSYGLGISEPMAREYQRRYGLAFAAFGNCVDPADFAGRPGPARPATDGAVLDLVYVGGLHLDRWRSLRRVGEALGRLAADGLRARLTVHAPAQDLDRYGERLGLPGVRLGRSLASDEVAGVLRRADVLVHVESFAEEHCHFTRYSLSTKIPQYLAAGRPVLGFGPAELASMAHLDAAGAGAVVGVDDPARLAREVARLCADPALRERLGRQGLDFAVRHHRADQVAARFAKTLARAARGPVGPAPQPRRDPAGLAPGAERG
ncbi:glycosyl transferase family 1 [Micromonospora sp. NBC_01655]|uniref:glycosyltransferase family protein n=1 Tax=Micromonospora sp. NBC_01655 TaxID=2975983 RepID=UPI002255284D|nr:glycosyltransferase [Micromonospora sp. NBC_01655]MCX4473377.1 glycosyl transferase family 1 [Micromonospora sp. NBC_01655]